MSKEKIEQFWRDATSDDVVRVMAGGTVEARFRDPPGGWGDWVLRAVDNSTLFIAGWKDGEWFDHEGDNWTQCQVYDPPQWWLDKPDPGPGLRLLEKFPDEDVLLGDFVFCKELERWIKLDAGFDPGQRHGLWYRRRIEPVNPKFAVGQTVRVVGPKVKPARNWTAAMDEHIEQVYTVVSVQNYPGHPSGTADFYSVKGVVDWAFREDYLEAVKTVEMVAYQAEIGEVIEFPCGIKLAATSKGFEVTQ